MLTGKVVVDVCAQCDQIVISAHFIFPLSSGPPTLQQHVQTELGETHQVTGRFSCCCFFFFLQVFLVVQEKYVYEVLSYCILVLHGFFGIRKK